MVTRNILEEKKLIARHTLLQMFCHVSTAYCHLHERHLKEKAYPPPADPNKIIKAIEWMDEEIVDSMTDK